MALPHNIPPAGGRHGRRQGPPCDLPRQLHVYLEVDRRGQKRGEEEEEEGDLASSQAAAAALQKRAVSATLACVELNKRKEEEKETESE